MEKSASWGEWIQQRRTTDGPSVWPQMPHEDAVVALLDAYERAAPIETVAAPLATPEALAILALDDASAMTARTLLGLFAMIEAHPVKAGSEMRRAYEQRHKARLPIVSKLARRRLPADRSHAIWLLSDLTVGKFYQGDNAPIETLCDALVSLAARGLLDGALVAQVEAVVAADSESRFLARELVVRLRAGLRQALGHGDPLVSALASDAWSSEVRAFLKAASPDESARWSDLILHAYDAKGRPTDRWLAKARTLASAIGPATLGPTIVRWADAAPLGVNPATVDPRFPAPTHLGMLEENADTLRGLLLAWASTGPEDGPAELARLALRFLKKIPGIGSGSRKLGNACLGALGVLPGLAGVPQLSRLAGKLRTVEARKALEGALIDAAERAGLSRDDVEEVAVGDAGVDPATGELRVEVGPATAVLRIERGGGVTVGWIDADGRAVKSAPAAAKESDPDGVKDVGARAKELAEVLVGVRGRAERAWVADRTWTFGAWWTRWIDHSLVGLIGRRLVWSIDEVPVLWHDGALRHVDGTALGEVAATATVRLWHPVDAPDASVIEAWRDRLAAIEVTQPIRQVWREGYTLTPAERETDTYSNRFAAQVLRQHALGAIAKQRDWLYGLQGSGFSPVNGTPTRTVVHQGTTWRVTFDVPGDWEGPTTGAGILTWVTSGAVRFYRGTPDTPPVSLSTVPKRLFSELMRDVDLFVSVCSLGLDPDWTPGTDPQRDAVWRATSAPPDLSALAQIRRDVIARLLPRLAMAPRLRIEGTWLHVQGKLRSYKIHLASGVVFTDTQRFLCIVTDRERARATQGLLVPFEGDLLLSVILSKAALLVADDRIKDASILKQLD